MEMQQLVIEYHYADGNNGQYFIEEQDTIASLFLGLGIGGNFQAIVRPATPEEIALGNCDRALQRLHNVK